MKIAMQGPVWRYTPLDAIFGPIPSSVMALLEEVGRVWIVSVSFLTRGKRGFKEEPDEKSSHMCSKHVLYFNIIPCWYSFRQTFVTASCLSPIPYLYCHPIRMSLIMKMETALSSQQTSKSVLATKMNNFCIHQSATGCAWPLLPSSICFIWNHLFQLVGLLPLLEEAFPEESEEVTKFSLRYKERNFELH